jgi:hypothetical protein
MEVNQEEEHKTYLLPLLFSDEQRRIVRVIMPHPGPFIIGTLFHKHVLEHRSFADAAGKLELPPLYVDHMSNLYPHILPLWREGQLFTPSVEILHEVHRFVDYIAGSNQIWIDFAKYLCKPMLKFGPQFVPPAKCLVSHEDVRLLFQNPLFVECDQKVTIHPLNWIGSLFKMLKYYVTDFKWLPHGQFEMMAERENSQSLQISSQDIIRVFFGQPRASYFASVLVKGKSYPSKLPSDSPLIGTIDHFKLILINEIIRPRFKFNAEDGTKITKYMESLGLENIE